MLKILMPPNHRCIKNDWVFKIKHNGVYLVHLVACGYSQVPSVDFSGKYSPIVNYITFCILLLMVFHFGYLSKTVDVGNAFVYGNLGEEIYMECLQGMSNIGKDIASF